MNNEYGYKTAEDLVRGIDCHAVVFLWIGSFHYEYPRIAPELEFDSIAVGGSCVEYGKEKRS